MPRLVTQPGRPEVAPYDVPEGETTIGRAEDNAIAIVHRSLSRRHARLVRAGARVEVEDLASKNGTFVNGERIERRELRSGDVLRCGDVELSFVGDPPPTGPTRTVDVRTMFFRATELALAKEKPPARDPGARAAERLQVLLQVGQILSSPGPVAPLLEKILDLALPVLGVDRAAILMPGAGGALEPRVVRSRVPVAEGQRIWSQGIVDWVREHGAAALFADAKADPRIDPTRSVVHQSIQASMCAPLQGRAGLLGVLYADSVSIGRLLVEEDLELFGAFANQAAIAVENARLAERMADEAAQKSRLVRFFPPAVAERLLVAGAAPLSIVETEVTAVFCDISGYTRLAATMTPREVLAMLDEFFPVVADVIFRHEGTLEKYIGDAILAVWGAPFAGPDDADRAVAAAVEILRAVRGWRFGVHVGVHSGPVAAGNIGSERYLQYATVGDTTNIASRICGVAQEGEILISDATHAKLGTTAPVTESLEPVSLKGVAAPVRVFRVAWE